MVGADMAEDAAFALYTCVERRIWVSLPPCSLISTFSLPSTYF